MTSDNDLRPRVLLVDDDPPLVRLLAEVLEARLGGVVVEACTSGEAALERIAAQEFDVVVTDCLMPGINGIELVSRIRAARPNALTMLVTGASDRDLTVDALRAGAYDFIHKPIDPDYLTASVRRAMETSRLRREVERQQQALKRHNEELERIVGERTRQLSEAAKMKDAFLATVSHELLTPLTAILGWARLLRAGVLEEPTRRQAIESIERNAKSQAQLVDDLLDVSRILAGKLHVERRLVDVGALLEDTVGTLLPTARAKKILIQSFVPRDLGKIPGDPNRLRQVFWNLLSNAVKFSDPGARVELQVAKTDSQIEVKVIDGGCGIAPGFLPHVFERLRQGTGGNDDEARRGLGLGLAIARHIVELHDGRIAAASAGVGAGSTFTVTLPTRLRGARDADRPPSPTWRTEQTGPPRDMALLGVHVLLVEDEADARDVLSLTLQRSGAVVTTAGTAVEALEVFNGQPPDVLLCDIGLPGMDGYELIGRVRALAVEHGGRVPAVALTAHARPEDGARALAAGFQLHLPKPGPSDLGGVVADLLSETRQRHSISPDVPPGI